MTQIQPESLLENQAATTMITDLRVLIVDDEPMLRSVIQDFLTMLGVTQQYVAGDGVEALEVIRSRPIDCMLSDIRMPKMELEELLGIIQREYPALIVIATSGYDDLGTARNIFCKGAHDFLGKPLNLDDLELSLRWIAERRSILQAAGRLFGKAALNNKPEHDLEHLKILIDAVQRHAHHFQNKIHHAIRLTRLAQHIRTDLEPAANVDLQVAALLHEVGIGYQIQTLCRKARRLDEDELRLVQEHAHITGRLVSLALARPEFEVVLGHHLVWQSVDPGGAAYKLHDEYVSIWLGLLNNIDGCLHDRPDRPAITPAQLRGMLHRRYKQQSLKPIAQLLDQWPTIETFYSSRP